MINLKIHKIHNLFVFFSSRLDTTQSKGYPSQGGHFYEEAILLLRKFYVRENKHGKYGFDSLSVFF